MIIDVFSCLTGVVDDEILLHLIYFSLLWSLDFCPDLNIGHSPVWIVLCLLLFNFIQLHLRPTIRDKNWEAALITPFLEKHYLKDLPPRWTAGRESCSLHPSSWINYIKSLIFLLVLFLMIWWQRCSGISGSTGTLYGWRSGRASGRGTGKLSDPFPCGGWITGTDFIGSARSSVTGSAGYSWTYHTRTGTWRSCSVCPPCLAAS